MATTDQQEFDISASLLELYRDLPYVTKLGYTVGEIGGAMLLNIAVEDDDDGDKFHEYSMAMVRKAREFEDAMPASTREEYEVLPLVTDPKEWFLFYSSSTTMVIDR